MQIKLIFTRKVVHLAYRIFSRRIYMKIRFSSQMREIENTSWKVLAYGIYARVVDVSEIERVSAANE